MNNLIDNFKAIFFNLHGSLLLKNTNIPDELNDFYNKVYHDMNMEEPSNDKRNLNRDFRNLKKDFKSAMNQYRLKNG